MKLQKGKFYKTRSGEKVECLTTERNGKQPVIMLWQDGDITQHYLTGEYFMSKTESSRDIISEWSDVEIPWDDYPSWCNWVAMDEDGKWFGYIKEPTIASNIKWTYVGAIRIPSEYEPKGFNGDWKESKFERPKKKEI